MRAYAALQSDCTTAARAIRQELLRGAEADFWLSAAYACAGLRSRDTQTWAAFTQTWISGVTHAPSGCLEATASAWLKALATASRGAGQMPNLRVGPSRTGYACPLSNGAVTPRTGRASQPVTVTWDGAPWAASAAEILFGGVKAARGTEGSNSVEVSAPAHAPGRVQVQMDFGPGRLVSLGTFTYAEEPSDATPTTATR